MRSGLRRRAAEMSAQCRAAELRAQPHVLRPGAAGRPDGRDEVDRAVLSLATPFVNYGVPAVVAREAAELYDDEIATLAQGHARQFEGWALSAAAGSGRGRERFRRAVPCSGFGGGYLSSNVNGRYLDLEEFAPIFAAATDLGVPLFVHPLDRRA